MQTSQSMSDWDPASYLALMAEEVAGYERLQDDAVAATAGVDARSILELGIGTAETARRLLAAHPRAHLHGIDSSAPMLVAARAALDPARTQLTCARLEDPLPAGPFDLVVSALTIHHLDAPRKADLFERIAAVLAPGGRFVLADVVTPRDPAEAAIPLEEGYDTPSSVDEQTQWLAAAGLTAEVRVERGDLAVIVATRPAAVP